MRRTDQERVVDAELLVKFYRTENEKLRRNLDSRDDFLVERELFSEFVEWLKERE